MTPFAKRVYKIVSRIPLGEVRTYKWVALKAGNPGAYRAVGQVLKNNPYPLIIPCHRVINSDNKLGGYMFGARRKKSILGLEKKIKECLRSRG
jgi:methylated-DNA-[protein]-cysteine S-methyltransferase